MFNRKMTKTILYVHTDEDEFERRRDESWGWKVVRVLCVHCHYGVEKKTMKHKHKPMNEQPNEWMNEWMSKRTKCTSEWQKKNIRIGRYMACGNWLWHNSFSE